MTSAEAKNKKKDKKSFVQSVKENNEQGARLQLIEELFYDFHSSRRQVYTMNFFRGLFFGFGSVLGATLLVALVIWLLGQFGNIFPPIADFINNLVDTMQQRR